MCFFCLFFCWAGSNRVGWCLLWTMSLWRLGWCACQVWLGRRLTMDCKCLGFVVTQEKSRKTSPKLLGVYQKKQVDTISRAHCWNTLRCVVFIRGIWATTSTHLLLSRSLLSQSHRTSLCQPWESPEWLSGGRTLPKNLEKIQVNQGSNRTCTIYWAVHVGFGGVFPPQILTESENQPFEQEIHLLLNFGWTRGSPNISDTVPKMEVLTYTHN